MEFTPGIHGWFNVCKPVFVIHQINKIKNKNHLNKCKKKGYEKIQHPFFIASINKLGIEEMYLNKIKTIYEKPIANIILNGEKLKAFPLRSETRQGCPLPSILFSIILEVLAIVIM